MEAIQRKPDWLKIRITAGAENTQVKQTLERLNLNTICSEGNCPNRLECFHRRTATFLIMGKHCTRNCRFCNVAKGDPEPPEEDEPERVAQAAAALKLRHVVVTSVTRDDLPDGGAGFFARTIEAIRRAQPQASVEVLIPDFRGKMGPLATVVAARPDILNHNVETVPSLYDRVRPKAAYARSLELLKTAKHLDTAVATKSGLMVGLGETRDEVVGVLRDLRGVRCDIVTIGQYLAPSKQHMPVAEYVRPEVFEEYRRAGLELGIPQVVSSPLTRSSYHAQQAFDAVRTAACADLN